MRMASRTLARNGESLSFHVQIEGWYAYINGGDYAQEQQEALASALMAAQESEFDALLPDGCYWSPRVSEVTGPVGTDLEAALASASTGRHESAVDDAMELARHRAVARFAAINREALRQ